MVPKGRVQASPSQSVNEWVVGEGERAQQWYKVWAYWGNECSALHSQDKHPKLCRGEDSHHPLLSSPLHAGPAPSHGEVQSGPGGVGDG